MTTLLISKINDIKVMQVGESKLSVSNKYEDGSKVGGRLADGTVGEGFNQTVDLGRGQKKHSLRVYASSKDESDSLFKVLYEERYCEIVDKFKGRIKVYIDSVDVTDSDSHIGRTIFEIDCLEQDEEILPSINSSVVMANEVIKMEKEIVPMVSKFALMCDTVETKLDWATGKLEFVNSAIEVLRNGVLRVIDVQVNAYNAYREIMGKANTTKRLFDSILNLKILPSELSDVLIGVTKQNNTKTTTKSFNAVTGRTTSIQKVQKSEIVELPEPQIRGVDLSKIDVSELSQFEVEQYERDKYAYQIVSKVKVIRDMRSMLVGGFSSQEDFELTVNATIKRLYELDYSIEEASDKAQVVKLFANHQQYRDIIEIDVKKPKPLVAIVYDRYGSLDNYESIEAVNNFKENDYVVGKVKVFS